MIIKILLAIVWVAYATFGPYWVWDLSTAREKALDVAISTVIAIAGVLAIFLIL